MLRSGKVKLSTTSRESKTIITKISEPGDVLGLNAVISNRPYELTAEMMEPTKGISIEVWRSYSRIKEVSSATCVWDSLLG